MIKLSVALAVFNESRNLSRCLTSIKDIADEIVIVDGGSTDDTVQIAKKFHAKVIESDNPRIFHINKEKALAACQGEWILQLDSDEEVTPQLAREIKHIIYSKDTEIKSRRLNPKKEKLFQRHQHLVEGTSFQKSHYGEVVAFYLPRKNFFLGKPITHAGTYPDGVIRLVRRGFAHFPSRSVHEQIEVKGQTAWLENDLLHYSNPTWSKYMLGMNRYTTLLAEEWKSKDVKFTPGSMINNCVIKPFVTFLALYFRYKGFVDGWRGILFSFLSSCHYPVAYYKLITHKV